MSLTTIATYTIGGGGSGSSSPPNNDNHPYDLVLAHGSVIDFIYPPNPSSSAIVNAANERCLGGGGIDGAINDAGGRTLIADRRALPIITTTAQQSGSGGGGNGVRCPTGNAVITGPNTYGRLHVPYVIHAVGPNYSSRYSNMNEDEYNDYDANGTQESDDQLSSAYISALECGKEANLEAIAFSLLSAGIYRGHLPLSVVLRIGMEAICSFQGYPGLKTVCVCAYTQDEIDTLLQIAEGMGLSQKEQMEDGEHETRLETNAMPPSSSADEKVAVAEEWEVRRDELKELGDAHFRSKAYADAIQAYQDALDLDPTNHILLSNKSAAHLANGEKSKSLHDARKCVEHAPTWGKGHTRLAAAMASLGRYNEAVAVYTKVLNELDPTNDMAKRGLEECRLKQQTVREEKEREASALQKELDRQKADQGRQENNDVNATTGVEDEGDELLDDFFSEVDKVATKQKPSPSSKSTDSECADDSMTNRIKDQLSDLGTSEYQINRILQTNYEWKNLNPYHVLDIPHTIEDESIISLRYRALSLLVHPDKCPQDPVRAKDAFEQVRKAMTQMNDTDKRRHVQSLIEQGMKQGRRDWEAERSKGSVKSTNDDIDGLVKAQNKATMKIFAEIEHTRRDIDRRKQKFEQRERSQEDEEKMKEKNEREHDKRWREGERVEKRVDNWRDFAGGGGDKTGKKGRLV